MDKLITNAWRRQGACCSVASILVHEVHPEGLDVERVRWDASGTLPSNPNAGHLLSVLRGQGLFECQGALTNRLRLRPGVHMYVPPGVDGLIAGQSGLELLRVSSASPAQARGTEMVVRDEEFVSACASGTQSLRWILTPQYLSRRIFLRHDRTLVSRSGNPVSWFRTTMFDVAGLPENEDGESVFKMSYNSRTEFNVCYDVSGTARVRMALHPYRPKAQRWAPWLPLDGDSTYHLNETLADAERDGGNGPLRNKHEVYIADGHVTLFCLFDPAPTGVERHQPGEYSDYEPLDRVMGTPEYIAQQREIAKYDEMTNLLSFARASDRLGHFRGSAIWNLHARGRQAQMAIESALAGRLAAEGRGRERVVRRWMLDGTPVAEPSALHMAC